jgi:hypothetical protein
MFLKTLGIGISALLLITTPVKAEWGAAKWGMTPEQVSKVAPGKLEIMDGTCGENFKLGREVYNTYWTGYSAFYIVCYVFDSKQLSEVILFSNNISTHLEYLTKKYKDAPVKTNSVGDMVTPTGALRRYVTKSWKTKEEEVIFKTVHDDGKLRLEIVTFSKNQETDD